MLNPSTYPRVSLSPTARARLEELEAARHGRHVLVMHSCCAAPSVVQVIPAREFRPTPRQAQVAVVSQHAVWADEAELRTCPHGSLIIVPGCGQTGLVRLVARPDDPQGRRRS